MIDSKFKQRTVSQRRSYWLVTAFLVSALIAIAVVIRRSFALLSKPSGRLPQMNSIDATFAAHRVLTFLHILPAGVFVVVAVALLLHAQPALFLKRAFYVLGFWTGLTAYAMNAYAIGGNTERSAVLLFNTLYLAYLARALWLSRQQERGGDEHRWMLRAVGVLLGIATTRPVMGAFFATQRLSHLRPDQFFGVAFWIGFSINTIAVELWLRSNSRRQRWPANAAKLH